ncbi:MAG: NTP/NDP exchange transporter [Pseudomarimonas sp.]
MSATAAVNPASGWNPLSNVRPDERHALIWSFTYFFCLLTAYYVLRPVRDAMGASSDAAAIFPPFLIDWAAARGWALGDFTLQLLYTATFIVMLLLQPCYGALVSRFPRRVFLPLVYGFFIVCLGGFYVAFDSGFSGRGMLFFVWVAVFNMFAVSVFWSYMSDIFADIDARRLYGYIGAGGTLGGLLGPEITAQLVGTLGVANMLLISAAFLGVCLVCNLALAPAARRREIARGERDGDKAMGGSALASFRLIATDPVLRAMALVLFFGVAVGTLLYNEQVAIARAMAQADAGLATQFFSRIDRYINWLVLAIQVLLTRQLLTRFGLAPLLLLPPAAILLGYCVLAAAPLPMLVAVVQVVTRASEFALSKPARETIYTRVDRESRYKAKATIDTAIYRFSDLTFAWVHKGLSLFGSKAVFGAGIGLAAIFGWSAWQLVKAQRALPQK